MPFNTHKLFGLVIVCSVLTACSSLSGPNFSSQTQQQLEGLQAWQQGQNNAQDTRYLTDLINADEARRLVKHGLSNNPTVQQSSLAIAIARESVRDSSGDALPQVALELNGNKTEQSSTQFESDLSVSWTVDWLGKLKDSTDIERTALNQTIAADQYTRDLLAAEIMDTWLQLVQQHQLIKIEEARQQVLIQNETTIIERYRKGLDTLSNLDSARSSSASSRATLRAYQESYNVLQRTIIAGLLKTIT